MKRVAIVQARMTSTRLPGKILMDLQGRPMLAHQLDRLRRSNLLDQVIVATTTGVSDDRVVELCRMEDVPSYRGSEHDVLGRMLGAARQADADVVVRVTADCPLIDPEVVDRIVARLLDTASPCDYASNTVTRSFPRGLDAEAMFLDTLERTGRLAVSRPAREHVTWFLLRERPDLFLTAAVTDPVDNSDLRWTVDTTDDFRAIQAIYQGLDLARRQVGYQEILKFVRSRPELSAINRHVEQKEG